MKKMILIVVILIIITMITITKTIMLQKLNQLAKINPIISLLHPSQTQQNLTTNLPQLAKVRVTTIITTAVTVTVTVIWMKRNDQADRNQNHPQLDLHLKLIQNPSHL